MKRKLKSDRGFTLAELLIVVAIIGVLVAIAIPIFTSQLERSREAVDLSDVRSAYAEVMMAAITGDTSATYTKDSGQKIYKETDGTYSIMVTPLKQQKDDWQTPLPITIGGVSSSASEHYWVGSPGAEGSCKITDHPPTNTGDEYVSFYWTGGTDNGNNPDLTPVPTQPILPIETPTPTLVPVPSQPGDNTGSNIPDNAQEIIKSYGSSSWPDRPNNGWIKGNITKGQIVYYGGTYYVAAADNEVIFAELPYNKTYYTPIDRPWLYIPIKNNVHTKVVNGNVTELSYGDLFKDNDSVYIYKVENCPSQAKPTGSSNDQWVKLNSTTTPSWKSSDTWEGLSN